MQIENILCFGENICRNQSVAALWQQTCAWWSMGWSHFPVNKVIICEQQTLCPLHLLSTSSELLTSDDGVTRSWVLIIPGPLLTNCHQPHTTQTPSHAMLASDWLLSVLSGLSLVTHHPTKSDHQTVSSIINNIQHTLSTFHYPPCYNIGRVQIRWNNI